MSMWHTAEQTKKILLEILHQYGDELNGGLGYDRTNLGLLKIMNSGLVLANDPRRLL